MGIGVKADFEVGAGSKARGAEYARAQWVKKRSDLLGQKGADAEMLVELEISGGDVRGVVEPGRHPEDALAGYGADPRPAMKGTVDRPNGYIQRFSYLSDAGTLRWQFILHDLLRHRTGNREVAATSIRGVRGLRAGREGWNHVPVRGLTGLFASSSRMPRLGCLPDG